MVDGGFQLACAADVGDVTGQRNGAPAVTERFGAVHTAGDRNTATQETLRLRLFQVLFSHHECCDKLSLPYSLLTLLRARSLYS